MYPLLLHIGSFPVSSFGLFLSLGIFFGGFVVWRISRGYELDSEKILDLIFLTVGGGFITSRLIFVLTNLNLFDSFTKVFFLNKYPGLSLWGGFLGGLLLLYWLAKKNKINFLQTGDFAIVGFFLAAFFAEIGCLLGSCGSGLQTNLFFAVEQEGVIGNRFPIQLFESLIFLIAFLTFWKKVLRFHVEGSILAKGLIFAGLVKFVSEFFKAEPQNVNILNYEINPGMVFPALVFGIGLKLYYQVYKKTPKQDLLFFWKFLLERKTQMQVIANIQKWCYNHWVNLRVNLTRGKKRLFKLLNIRPNPESF